MKTNGILTFHYSYNEGAIWQAYCLFKVLSKFSESEIIDHQYPTKVNYYGNPNKREKALEDFVKNNLIKSPLFFKDQHKETFQYINKNYNNLIIGSDQVWKLKYKKNNRFLALFNIQNHPMHPSFPNVYWPNEMVLSNKILYAGSIGPLNKNSIFYPHRIMMKRILSNFKLIGYRDTATKEFINWLDPNLNKISKWVPDPTFSFSVIDKKIKENLKNRLINYEQSVKNKKIIGIISNENKSLTDFLKKINRKKYILIGLSIKNKNVDIDFSNEPLSPIEWVNFFSFFDYCLTEKMHGAIACILNNKPFLGLGYYENNIDGNSTLLDLMIRMQLETFYLSKNIISEKKLNDKFDHMIKNWPYENVENNTLNFKKKSNEFINEICTIK